MMFLGRVRPWAWISRTRTFLGRTSPHRCPIPPHSDRLWPLWGGMPRPIAKRRAGRLQNRTGFTRCGNPPPPAAPAIHPSAVGKHPPNPEPSRGIFGERSLRGRAPLQGGVGDVPRSRASAPVLVPQVRVRSLDANLGLSNTRADSPHLQAENKPVLNASRSKIGFRR
jgi:hypothetical protein